MRSKKMSLLEGNNSLLLTSTPNGGRRSIFILLILDFESSQVNIHSKEILIFSSHNENLVDRWVSVLNYFVKN